MLENFIKHLIPRNDPISPKTENYIKAIESEGLNRYPIKHHSKAFIHAWLACQAIPGFPLGQAITAQLFDDKAEMANRFVRWLNRLFVGK